MPYGLAAYAFTGSAANVDQLIDGIEAGNLSINTLEATVPETPFGGVEHSGYGHETNLTSNSFYLARDPSLKY